MVKIIYDLLVAKQIVVQQVKEADYWEETDGEIVLSDVHYIQVGQNYLTLWECINVGMPYEVEMVVYEVILTKLDNTKRVSKFIKKVKAICKTKVDDLYDYSAE